MASEDPARSKLYTRSGDTGLTGLFGGGRVPKDHPRVSAYGAVDELNSAIGVAIAFITDDNLTAELSSIQNELFNIGSELASETAGEKAAAFGQLFTDPERKIAALEALTDRFDTSLPQLETFILPSGSQAGALLHLCRTVCRRAEREVVHLNHEEPVNPDLIKYLNRLSDLLFALARFVNHADGKPETPWRKG